MKTESDVPVNTAGNMTDDTPKITCVLACKTESHELYAGFHIVMSDFNRYYPTRLSGSDSLARHLMVALKRSRRLAAEEPVIS